MNIFLLNPHVSAGFFTYRGSNNHVMVDWYSDRLIIECNHDGARDLVDSLDRVFATFSTAARCTSDGDSEFISAAITNLLKDWVIQL